MVQTNVLTEIRTVVNSGRREGELVVRKRHNGGFANVFFLDLGDGYTEVSIYDNSMHVQFVIWVLFSTYVMYQ